MKIVINTLLLLSSPTGAGNYAYQVCRHLQQTDGGHDYTFFYGYYSKSLRSLEKSSSSLSRLKDGIRRIPGLGTAVKNLRGIRTLLPSSRFDLYFEPHFIPLNIRARRRVVTVLDFSFALFPEWHPPDKSRYFEKHFWEKIKKADHLIVISESIRTEAIRRFGFSPESLTTIHPGIDHDLFRKYLPRELEAVKTRYRLPEDFLLFVGSLEPRKNLKNLLQAYLDLGAAVRKGMKLVLAGFKGWENTEIMALIRKGKPDISYLGYLPPADLAGVYNLARLFVYPSFYEGFGLPPLEAMACGCPVVVSNTSSLPEACGEAACYVLPEDIQSIIAGISAIWGDEKLRQSLIRKGIERAKIYSWERSAREHLAVFEKVAGG
jgi:glycosyltransferase involved in cell wall biosynthesis